MNWKGCRRKRSLPDLRHYWGICLEGLRKTTKNLSQDSKKHIDLQYTQVKQTKKPPCIVLTRKPVDRRAAKDIESWLGLILLVLQVTVRTRRDGGESNTTRTSSNTYERIPACNISWNKSGCGASLLSVSQDDVTGVSFQNHNRSLSNRMLWTVTFAFLLAKMTTNTTQNFLYLCD
jgi:hypothetical protein